MQLIFEPFIEICAFGFLLVVTATFFLKEKLFTVHSKIYAAFLIAVLISLALDITVAYTIYYGKALFALSSWIINPLQFLFNITSAAIFFIFSVALTIGIDKARSKPLFYIILLIPFLIGLAMIVVNYSKGILFYFDKSHIYHYGSYLTMFNLVSVFYLFCGIIFSVVNKSNITLPQLLTIILYAVFVGFALTLESFYPNHMLTGAFEALGLLSIYFTFQNPDAFIDSMTNIFGRSAFLIIVEQTIRRMDNTYKVVTVDINGFKAINNHFGISVGDVILVSVSGFLQTLAPSKRSIFRIGGDQFALILDDKDADRCIELIRRRFRYSWQIEENRIQLSVSISKISTSNYAFNKELLMQIIYNSIVLAKEAGIGSYINVDNIVTASIKRRLKIESCLHDFEKNNSLRLYLQPIYNIKKKRITSAEVLLRMKDKDLGEVSPDEFISIAERLGMTNRIGRFLLNETCRFIHEHQLVNYGIESVAMNLSAADLLQENYADYIKKVLITYPFEKSILTYEVTETIATTVRSRITEIMSALKPLGIKFSLDDYSQGYSNIQALTSLPFNSVKLDKDFLWKAFESEKAEILYSYTVKMLKQMGLKVISEGAETSDHIKYLNDLGVDYIQGYYYSKPISKDVFLSELLEANAAASSKPQII